MNLYILLFVCINNSLPPISLALVFSSYLFFLSFSEAFFFKMLSKESILWEMQQTMGFSMAREECHGNELFIVPRTREAGRRRGDRIRNWRGIEDWRIKERGKLNLTVREIVSERGRVTAKQKKWSQKWIEICNEWNIPHIFILSFATLGFMDTYQRSVVMMATVISCTRSRRSNDEIEMYATMNNCIDSSNVTLPVQYVEKQHVQNAIWKQKRWHLITTD